MTTGTALTRDKVLEIARNLPATPRVFCSLSELLQDVDTDLGDIAAEIRTDPALAARVLRVANSAAYGGDGDVATVEDAVGRVGYDDVVRLVGVASVGALLPNALAAYRVDADALRRSALLQALGSEAIAPHLGIDPRHAYTAGLLRSIGMLVLDAAAHSGLPTDDHFDHRIFKTYTDWEVAMFGVTNADVTRMVLDDWKFPNDLVSAIDEHLLVQPEQYHNIFACVINMAGTIALDAGVALPGDVPHWNLTREKLTASGLADEDWVSAYEVAKARFERQCCAV